MNYSLKLLFSFILIFLQNSFSQETDSLKQPNYENFFGSHCSNQKDLYSEELYENDYCNLYVHEFMIQRIRKGKEKWHLVLDDFQKNADYMCLIPIYVSTVPKRKCTIIVAGYTIQGDETGVKFISFRSGKIISER